MMYTILICDDDKDIVSALDIYLTSEGYQTVRAYNGKEALRAMDTHEIHLILMDVMMPEQSGLTFYGAVCRDEDWKRIPVVMLSAVPISVREHAFATIGLTQGPLPAPAACLEKPCTPEALLEVVNRLVPEPTTA